jgi:hypothetical protein
LLHLDASQRLDATLLVQHISGAQAVWKRSVLTEDPFFDGTLPAIPWDFASNSVGIYLYLILPRNWMTSKRKQLPKRRVTTYVSK